MSMVRKLRERFHVCRGFADLAIAAPWTGDVGVTRLDDGCVDSLILKTVQFCLDFLYRR
jgi:hypothetical protein